MAASSSAGALSGAVNPVQLSPHADAGDELIDAPPPGGGRDLNARQLHYLIAFFMGLALIPVFLPFLVDARLVLRADTACQALFVLGVFLSTPREKLFTRTALGLATLGIALLGTLVGLYYCMMNVNSWSTWVEYSALAISWWLALVAGHILGDNAPLRTLERLILVVAAAEGLLLIPRILVLGLENRSAWGSSLLICPLFLLYLETPKPRVRFAALVLLFGIVGTVLLSGMRARVGLMMLSFMLGAAFVASRRQQLRKHLARLAVLVVIGVGLFVLAPGEYKAWAQRILDVMLIRVQQSVLAEEVRFDPSEYGRELEMGMALERFELMANPFSRLYGFGHGFTYTWLGNGISGHVHITPVAFYVRYGYVGLAFFVYLLGWNGWILVSAWRQGGGLEAALAFGVQVAAVTICLGAFVAGFLVPPMAWLTIGLGLGMNSRVRRRRALARSVEPEGAIVAAPAAPPTGGGAARRAPLTAAVSRRPRSHPLPGVRPLPGRWPRR